MPALDGKYEIGKELHQDGFLKVYEVAGPEGEGTLYWFEVHTPEARAVFYRYRKALKRLEELGVLRGVTISAKPGRYYVFWPRVAAPAALPPKGRRVRQEVGRVLEALAPFQYALPDLDLRLEESGLVVADLKPLAQHTPEEIPRLNGQFARYTRARPARRSRRWAGGWVPGLLMALLGAVALGQGVYRYLNPPEYTLPDLKGLSPRAALEQVHDMGLRIEFREASDPTRPRDVILEQTPDPGTRVKPGRRLELVLNRPKPGRVPELAEMGVDEAQKTLEDSGYAVGRVVYVHADAPQETVIATRPAASTPLALGQPVDLLVSQGPAEEQTVLPDLRGLSLEEAQYLLSVADLRVGAIQEELSPAPPGEVLDQSPPPGVVLPVGSPVTLKVSTQAEVLLPAEPPGPLLPQEFTAPLEPGPALPSPAPAGEEPAPDLSLPAPTELEPGPQALEPAPSLPPGARLVPIRIPIARDLGESPVHVRLVVVDEGGEREAFNTFVQPGSVLEGSLEVRGTATFRLYLNDFLYQEWQSRP